VQLEVNWCAPVSGDGAQLGLPTWERPPTLDATVAIFEAAARQGFSQVLLGMGFNRHVLEAWTLGTAVLAKTKDISAMIAVRPGFYSAPVLAKMASTLDHISEGRLSLNVVTGGRPGEQAMYGDYLDHDARYRRTAEFMRVCRRLWTEPARFDHEGEFYRLRRTHLEVLPRTPGGPRYYFGGASGIAEMVSAELADVYLLWGESFAETSKRLARMRWLVAQANRTDHVRYGLRINVIARATNAEARAAARHLIAPVTEARLVKARERDLVALERDSVGQRKQWELFANADADGYVEDGLWAGIAAVRSGAGMALVGDYDEVAALLARYVAGGVSVFILSGYPHLEECENVGQNVIPRLRQLVASAASAGGLRAGPGALRRERPTASRRGARISLPSIARACEAPRSNVVGRLGARRELEPRASHRSTIVSAPRN
jgi:alkanesulfonate monooxygenase